MHNETVVITPNMFFDENRHENSWTNEFKQMFAKYWTVLLKGAKWSDWTVFWKCMS